MTNRGKSSGEVAQWIAAARSGSNEAIGQMLEACRQYLLLVANQELDNKLRGKVGPSDVVQDTFLEAQQDFAGFHGNTEEELLAWLRKILLNNLANTARHYCATGKRLISLEVPLAELSLEHLHKRPPPAESPSARVRAEEESLQIDRAIGQLPDPLCLVVRLRHQEHLSFEEIGQRLGQSDSGARKLWGRAIELLQDILEPPNESG